MPSRPSIRLLRKLKVKNGKCASPFLAVEELQPGRPSYTTSYEIPTAGNYKVTPALLLELILLPTSAKYYCTIRLVMLESVPRIPMYSTSLPCLYSTSPTARASLNTRPACDYNTFRCRIPDIPTKYWFNSVPVVCLGPMPGERGSRMLGSLMHGNNRGHIPRSYGLCPSKGARFWGNHSFLNAVAIFAANFGSDTKCMRML